MINFVKAVTDVPRLRTKLGDEPEGGESLSNPQTDAVHVINRKAVDDGEPRQGQQNRSRFNPVNRGSRHARFASSINGVACGTKWVCPAWIDVDVTGLLESFSGNADSRVQTERAPAVAVMMSELLDVSFSRQVH